MRSPADMPDQSGRTVLVTGATSGLGLASAVAFAAAGARVLVGARNAERGAAAVAKAGGKAELLLVDLADLESVRDAAQRVLADVGELDVLMNNAGVTGTPAGLTVDGFETQIGTNHHGHAALTWQLMPALRAAGTPERPSRVVTVASLAHKMGGLDVDDMHFLHRHYRSGEAYGQSKLANLLWAAELDRRLREAGDPVISVAAHPGLSDTELFPNAARSQGSRVLERVAPVVNRLITQSAEQGVLPQLHVATAPDLRGGEYFGPDGRGETRGYPAPASRSKQARDIQLARRLWLATAEQTGVRPDPA